jgi:hypothetical protein
LKIEIPDKLVAAAILSGLSFGTGAVVAAGFPSPEDALTYSGRLLDSAGNPRTTTESITVTLFSAASGGQSLCAGSLAAVNLAETSGRFAVPLPALCVEALTDSGGGAFAEVRVGNVTLPRQKIGAAPYALMARESQHAELADHADTAELAVAAQSAVSAQSAQTAVAVGVNGVTTAALGDGAVTLDKLAPSVVSTLSSLGARLDAVEDHNGGDLVIAQISTSQSIPREGAHVNWDVEVADRNGSLSGTTYAASEAGVYHLCASVHWLENADWPLATDIWVRAEVNIGNYVSLDERRQQSAYNGRLLQFGGCATILLAANDTVRIEAGQNASASARPIHPYATQLSIFRL